jgi:hypothetical protein
MILVRLFPLIALCACTLSGPVQPAAPTPQERVAAECAVLTLAAQRMAEAGNPAHDGLREGCPGVTAQDTRPLVRQTASLRAATAAVLPDGIAPGSRADQVFRRMITRGVPVAIATALTQDPAFGAATR